VLAGVCSSEKIFISATYCITLAYIYYHGIIDHSGITFKVRRGIGHVLSLKNHATSQLFIF
jgi:hypothetical protein